MSAFLVAVFALALTAPPLALHDSLRVVADDFALGEEIARAARRYMRGTVQARARDANSKITPEAPSDGSHFEREASLTVRQEPGGTKGQRWVLVLSSGSTRVIRRTLELHEVPSRFDLAEAVAIGLPDMLARLDEQAPTSQSEQAAPSRSIGPFSTSQNPVRPTMTMAARVAPISRTLPQNRPPQAPRSIESAAEKSPPPPSTLEEKTAPRFDGISRTPTAAPVAATPPPSPPPPVQKVAQAEPLPVRVLPSPAPLTSAPVAQEAPSFAAPRAAVGIVASGAVVLLGGIGAGAAAMMTARQVDTPTQMRFDQDLDRRGKALNTASIVLDCVGGAALVAGGTWLLTRRFKARREAPGLSLSPAGAGVVLRGSF